MTAPSVEIFSVVRDEEKFLKFFYEFYKKRLSNVTFNLLDMGSVDKTIEIAKSLEIKITNGYEEYFSDRTNLEYKSNCWKNSTADFVIIQDLDELLDVDDAFLINNEFSVIQAEAWDMVGKGGPIEDIAQAVRLKFYDKWMMFKTSHFYELQFSAGAHSLSWGSNISNPIFLTRPMFHYNRLSLEYVLEKYNARKARLSQENIEKGWGVQYLLSENEIIEEYASTLDRAIDILPTDSTLSPNYDPLETLVTFYRKHFGALARTIIDIGSRDGDDAKFLKDALNGQRVFAIEALPEQADKIKNTYPDFTVWCTGVSNFEGTSTFQKVISDNKEFQGSSSIESYNIESWYQFQLIEIPITTMKNLLESNFMKNEILDVVKIDCEGFSYQVLEGFDDILKNIRIIHIETEQSPTHPHHMNTEKVTELMNRNKFSLVEISSEWSNGIIDQIWVNRELAVYQREVL